MKKSELEYELNELVKESGGMINPRLQKSIDNLRESLDNLRICIKYLLFDIEATRRENEYLRNLLKKE